MKTNNSLKKIICFLLAIAMLLTVVGCSKTATKKKKKVIVKKKVVVVNDDVVPETTPPTVIVPPTNDSGTSSKRPVRDLPQIKTKEDVKSFDELHTEDFKPEFTSKNVAFDGPADYVIIYSLARTDDGVATNTGSLAFRLQEFFKEKDGVTLPVYKDTDAEAIAATKRILVGDTAFYTSSLKETEFAVTLKGSDLLFEGGHHVMAEKAVDWFMTIDRVSGKIATLTGTQADFVSEKTLDGKKYVYVWGDEFDGVEHIDSTKWKIGTHMPQWSDLEYINNNDNICTVKNGRLKFTGVRWKSETSNVYGYATCGSVDTENTLAYKGGYLEWTAKLSYTKGTLPAYWLMSNPEVGIMIPRSQYAAPWNMEIDMLEIFASKNQWDVSLHKYYKAYNYTGSNNVNYNNGIKFVAETITNDDGTKKTIGHTYFNGEEVTSKIKLHDKNWATHGLITSWRNYIDDSTDYSYKWSSEAQKTLNDEYHTYGFLYTDTGFASYLDGEKWLERDWDPAFDGFDANNNDGWGFDLWYYVIMNQHLYTPGSESRGFDISLHVNSEDLPISSYVDNVRLYQLQDSQYVISPGLNEFGSGIPAGYFDEFKYDSYETEYNTWH